MREGSVIIWKGFTPERRFCVREGLKLPLEHVSFLSGDGGFGRTATYYLPTERGVFVSRRGVISLHNHELDEELWRVETDGWCSSLLYDGQHLWEGPDDKQRLFVIDAATGRVVTQHQLKERVSTLLGFTKETLLYGVHGAKGHSVIRALSREGLETLWERPMLGGAASCGRRYLIDDDRGRVLHCLDSVSGRLQWRFVADSFSTHDTTTPGRIAKRRFMPPGFPSYVCVGDKVVVVLDDRRIVNLDLQTGRVLSVATPPFVGIHLVTEKTVFFLQPFGLAEFDHWDMEEVSRIEFKDEVHSFYGNTAPYPCALVVTEESVIWTNLDGRLMGVARRKPRSKARKAWAYSIEQAVMPIAEFPQFYDDYFYVADKGKNLGLHCFRGHSK